MNKMKVMVIAVLALVIGGFNLSAQTKINENKLTSLSYIKKICEVTSVHKCDRYTSYVLDNDKGLFLILKDGSKGTLIVKDGVLYGRRVYHIEDGTVSCNLHDTKCSVKGRLKKVFNDKDIEEYTSDMKSSMIASAIESGLIK